MQFIKKFSKTFVVLAIFVFNSMFKRDFKTNLSCLVSNICSYKCICLDVANVIIKFSFSDYT